MCEYLHAHACVCGYSCLGVRAPIPSISIPECFSLPLGRVDGYLLASLAPPVHLSGEKLGWTLLVCMVGDLRRGHLEVSWSSASEGHVSTLPYNSDANRKHRGHSAVAVLTVATRDWPSYTCSASHRQNRKVSRRHHSTPSGRPAAHSDLTAPLKHKLRFYKFKEFLNIFLGQKEHICNKDEETQGMF